MTQQRIRIDGSLFTVSKVLDYGDLPEIETDEGDSFILAKDAEQAGAKAAERWRDMAQYNPEEFGCMVGVATLIGWALDQCAGHAGCSSLEEFLELIATVPEKEFAGYDGQEREVNRVGTLVNELGFTPTVAYRSN